MRFIKEFNEAKKQLAKIPATGLVTVPKHVCEVWLESIKNMLFTEKAEAFILTLQPFIAAVLEEYSSMRTFKQVSFALERTRWKECLLKRNAAQKALSHQAESILRALGYYLNQPGL
jgi:hypothetical protein